MPELRLLVRIKETDIRGDLLVPFALARIKGIGRNLAEVICDAAGVPKDMRVGYLTDEQIEKLEHVIDNPKEYGLPNHIMNRQKDRVTGQYLILTGNDWIVTQKMDIDFHKNIRSYRGIRHMFGLRVRGQRTKTTGRKGQTVGVKKKKK